MKFLHITYHFEFSDRIEAMLERHEIPDYVRYPMVQGKDRNGKYFNTKVHPGSAEVVQAQVPDDALEELLQDMKEFKEAEKSHRHLTVLVLAVEKVLDGSGQKTED
jgi:hypothetical protein